MENLCKVLNLLFKDVSSKDIIRGNINYDKVEKSFFKKLALSHLQNFSGNNVENLYDYVMNELYDRVDGNSEVSVGAVLRKFNELVLKEVEEIPVCRYRHLLKWRMASFSLDEELFTTSFLAVRDWQSHRKEREDFSWKYVIGSDNVELNNMLNHGLAENHFHLKGSAPYFYMSWVNLMNKVMNRKFIQNLRQYDTDRQQGFTLYHTDAVEESLVVMHLQAALIRAYLYSWLMGRDFWIQESLYVPFEQIHDVIDWSCFDGQTCWEIKEWQEEEKTFWAGETIWRYLWAEKMNSHDFTYEKKTQWSWICQNLLYDIPFEKLKVKEGGLTERQLIVKCFGIGKMIRLDQEFVRYFVQCGMRRKVSDWIAQKEVEQLLQDTSLLIMSRDKLQSMIDNLRVESSSYKGKALDYLQNRAGAPQEDLYGERWLLYCMFRKLYAGDQDAVCRGDLFYAYLVLKERIRSELIQVNDKVGFDNFLRYQNRKEEFIDNTPLSKVYSRHAVVSSFSGQPLRVLEARITPRDTSRENRDYIKRIDSEILPEKDRSARKFLSDEPLSKQDFFYVFHFVKVPEENEKTNAFECRSYKLRKKVKKQANGIYFLRAKYVEQASRIRGIDACSPEIGCRPEVFAQAFRFLKIEQNFTGCVEPRKRRPRLRSTYHVGEDFLDIVDGMRAIDEAIFFLNMTHGDRLGHALALGISPREWYQYRENRIICCKQDMLDNIVWIYQRIRRYKIGDTETILMKLKRMYVHLYQEVYRSGFNKNESECDIDLYYDAWKLRGDNPAVYYAKDKIEEKIPLSVWEQYNLNKKYEELNIIRRERECIKLYHRYHYDEAAKKAGKKVAEYKIDRDIIGVVEKIQYHLQREVLEKGIAIETNPSSNYLISTFRAYEKHPIINWYNKGLTNDREQLDACPQLDVTINTDDQAVFGTSLENEFALMAVALEKAVDETGKLKYNKEMIYSWLDAIRRKGFTRCFQQERKEEREEEREEDRE